MPWFLRSVDPVRESFFSLKYGISPVTASVFNKPRGSRRRQRVRGVP